MKRKLRYSPMKENEENSPQETYSKRRAEESCLDGKAMVKEGILEHPECRKITEQKCR